VSVRERATTATAPEARIRKRRIVERPRLFALLDESKARVRMLVAPAGYGKTTLAEQWVARDGRRAAWFTARSSSTDVAALALGVARSATKIVEDCDVRLRAHMRALPAAAENVETLAEILGEDLGEWPLGAWLVIDDYHEVAQEPRAEDFVQALVANSSAQFLLASRVRPSWISTKDLMYGEASEVNQTALAMDNAEAADVLVGRSARSASGLVLLANGWPAVIGLASVSSAEIDDGVDQVPESLYRFFADEVFGSLGAEVRQGLTTLAVAPLLDHELATALLGSDAADLVCSAALDVGLLVEREQRLDLHPLARAFLEERSEQLGLTPAEGAAATCLDMYRTRREWDAAFEAIVRSGATAELEDLMRRALDELLDAARLSTLTKWCDLAVAAGVDAPIFAVARAETMLRNGRHVEAVAYAEVAAAGEPELEFRALSIAGRAAHLASTEESALALYRRAEAVASNDAETRDAKWGQVMCLVELERPEAEGTLRELEADVRLVDVRDFVRAAASELSFQVKLGNLDLHDADLAARLLGQVNDPLVVSSFQSTYSAVLGLVCRYEEAIEVARDFFKTIDSYRLDFATPYALCAASLAEAGLRRWDSSERKAAEALRLARRAHDGHAQQLCIGQLTRVLVQQGRSRDALELEVPVVRSPLPAAQAEVIGSRALALAETGRIDEARLLLDQARGLSQAVEPAVLISATEAICALKEHDPNAIELVVVLEDVAFRRGALDLLVTAYRASPELLRVLLHAATDQQRLTSLIRKVRDVDLAEFVGYQVHVSGDRRKTLTPREREVYELMIQGLKNREIAKLLFIDRQGPHTSHLRQARRSLENCANCPGDAREVGSGDVGHLTDLARVRVVVGALRELAKVLSFCEPVLLIGARQYCLERCNDTGVELALYSLSKSEAGHPTWHGVAIRPIRRHCVVCVRDRDDARHQRDAQVSETIRVSLPIDPLMVMADDG
jgi:ATP/maltotriose-dependent transcriptional regulator MalT